MSATNSRHSNLETVGRFPNPAVPDWFSRSTSKYWVQPQHRMRVKCEVIKNLPVSIYGGQRHKLAAGERVIPADLSCDRSGLVPLFVLLHGGRVR